MSTTTQRTRLGALVMTIVLFTAVFAATVTFSASVSAAVNSQTFTVTDDPVHPDGSITVEGNLDSTGDVTFLIQDPDDTDFATVTEKDQSTDFSVTIDLKSHFGNDLDGGEAKILVDKGSKFGTSEASTTFTVDDEYPTVSIESPSGDAELKSAAVIEGTASDENGLKSVKIAIENSDGEYYDESQSKWVSSETFVDVDGEKTDWSYDTSEKGGFGTDGSYTVTVKATDEAENTLTKSSGPPVPSGDTLQVEYTVDTTAPTVSNVKVTEKGADDTVSVGDTVKVSAEVSDETSSLKSVQTDASALGGPETLSLSKQDENTYYNTFSVESPPASDGSVSLSVEATDEFENDNSGSDSVTLEKKIDSVETLTIDHDFVGIVEDTDEVSVTAEGVEDAQGNAIASGDASTETATLEIAGKSYSIDVEDGEIDATIDPTKISDDTATGDTTVSIVEADSQPETTVELVHEAQALDEGYQLAGTPMDAEDVVFEDVSDAITTYDPTGETENTKWVSPDEEQAGSGYYVYGDSSDARIGYIFEENGELRSEKLHEGYNLVAATPDLNDENKVNVGTDLGSGVSVGSGDRDVQVYVRDENVDLTDRSGNADTSAFEKKISGSATVEDFEAYFVYVDSGEEIRTVDDEGYDASEGS